MPVELVLASWSVNLLYQFWIHTEAIDKLWPPVEWVFNTPSHHRVHHGSQPQYLDRNYGGILIVWDRLFGTFEPEGERVRYGLTKNLETFNPLRVATHEYVALYRDVRTATTWRDRFGYALHGPGWAPAVPVAAGASLVPVSTRHGADRRTRLSCQNPSCQHLMGPGTHETLTTRGPVHRLPDSSVQASGSDRDPAVGPPPAGCRGAGPRVSKTIGPAGTASSSASTFSRRADRRPRADRDRGPAARTRGPPSAARSRPAPASHKAARTSASTTVATSSSNSDTGVPGRTASNRRPSGTVLEHPDDARPQQPQRLPLTGGSAGLPGPRRRGCRNGCRSGSQQLLRGGPC